MSGIPTHNFIGTDCIGSYISMTMTTPLKVHGRIEMGCCLYEHFITFVCNVYCWVDMDEWLISHVTV
jgi:hypothetical protein